MAKTEGVTIYVKNASDELRTELNEAASREVKTLAEYVRQVHQFYQTRKDLAFAPDEAARGGPASDEAEILNARAAFLHGLAAVAEKVRGNSKVALVVRDVVVHQLAAYAPASRALTGPDASRQALDAPPQQPAASPGRAVART